jgi:hypothetical protein
VPARYKRNTSRPWFLSDLFAQLFSDRSRSDAGRYRGYNGILGLLLLAGAFVLRLSGPPNPLGRVGFALVIGSAAILLAALVVPLTRPPLVPSLLAAHGVVIIALTFGFALACAAWALGTPATRAFRYLPGLIVVGTTYGAALWADFGPARARPRPWRLAGFITGIALELVVAALLLERRSATERGQRNWSGTSGDRSRHSSPPNATHAICTATSRSEVIRSSRRYSTGAPGGGAPMAGAATRSRVRLAAMPSTAIAPRAACAQRRSLRKATETTTTIDDKPTSPSATARARVSGARPGARAGQQHDLCSGDEQAERGRYQKRQELPRYTSCYLLLSFTPAPSPSSMFSLSWRTCRSMGCCVVRSAPCRTAR